MVFRGSTLVLLFTGLSIAAPATADVVYLERGRAQSAPIISCDLLCLSMGGAPAPTPSSLQFSSTDFAPYTNTHAPFGAARSTLSYALTDDSISIDASAFVVGIAYWSAAYSALEVTFSLTTATAFTFAGSGTWDAFGSGAMDISLTGEGLSFADGIQRQGSCCQPADMFHLVETGVLGPGTYTLRASVWNLVGVEPDTAASLSARLTFLPTPVPLPATVWLLASGLAVLVARSRRSRHS